MLLRYELRARKGLGQHFLINSSVLKTITRAAHLSPEDLVLEVGPGMGVLTRELVAQSGYVIAIELDAMMAELLRETLSSVANFSLINQDVLEVDPGELIQQEKARFPSTIADHRKYKLVANLPYYITQPIIRHFCESKLKPQIMVIMVQKEVAKNIVAKPGDMSILAISVQFYGRPKIIDYVPAGNFFPAPKVDSAILKIEMYPETSVRVTSEENFFKVVRAGFSSARKQVANSLAQGLDMPKAEVLSLMQQAGVAPQKRAEDLTLEEWAQLEKFFFERNKHMMTATAPAKINLTLETLKKRPDGFHEIRSVVQTISFADKIKIGASPRLDIKCNLPEWSASKSLVTKAISLLRNSTGANQGALIDIEKRIPLSSGLGGDSSDAAAVLRGLNLHWNLKLSLARFDQLRRAIRLGRAAILVWRHCFDRGKG